MTRGKWILLSCLMLIILLLRKLLSNLGMTIISEAGMWLLLAVAAFFIVAIAVPKEFQKWAKWFAILFLLLAFTANFCKKEGVPKSKQNQGQVVPITNKKPVWEKRVEVTGRNPEGEVFFTDEDLKGPGYYDIEYLGGVIYDTPEDKIAGRWYDIHGVGYLADWKDDFIYSYVPGVKGLEALIIVDGEIGRGNETVYQFPDGKRKIYRIWVDKYLRFFRHEAFRTDYNNGNYYCFGNNYGKWIFKITKSK